LLKQAGTDFAEYLCGSGQIPQGGPAMQQIADWPEGLGLGQYAQRFAENDINFIFYFSIESGLGCELSASRQMPPGRSFRGTTGLHPVIGRAADSDSDDQIGDLRGRL
jgi:hypothetical protein